MQHASDALVADWKVGIVRTALAAQSLDAPIRGIETSPTRSRRRARFAARRTKSGALAGFHGRKSDVLVDVVDCPLISDDLAKGLDLTRALAVVGASRKGEILVQCNAVQGGLDVSVEDGKPLDQELRIKLPQIAAEHGVLRLTWNGELAAQLAPPQHKIGKADVPLPPGAFLQATEHGEKALQAFVLEATEGAHAVADLFAGCGTFSLRLAERGPVTAVEGDKPMTRALQEAANHAGLAYPVRSLTRDLFDDPLTEPELAKFDAVVLDPPRAGAQAQAQRLAKSDVPVIAYISCDPASFARDVRILVDGGYQVEWVHVVDQFRWSPHTEVAARLTKSHMQPGRD
ncbi:class I SAM-dependent RNA methyltransferase [Aliishimia ponticola]|nr:RsmD family RNA methyltransferase [Aliishimia ponticola]